MKTKSILLFLCLSIFAGGMFAQKQIFVDFSDDCFEEFVYQDNEGNTTQAFTQINSNNERIILQLSEKPETRYRAPQGMIACKDMLFTAKMVNDLRTGREELMAVQRSRSGRGFQIYPVTNVIEIAFTDNFMEYTDSRVDFAYDFRPTNQNVNLANPRSGSRIYFDRAESYRCPRQFRFKQVFDRAGNDYQYITIAENVGLVQTTNPPRPPVTVETVTKLVRASGKPLKSYYAMVCSENYTKPGDYTDANGKPVTGPEATTPWEKSGKGRIYRDLNSGLYIDRTTWTIANLEYGGFLYVDGKQYSPDDPNAPSIGATGEQGRGVNSPCSFYYDNTIQLFMDRSTQLPAEGTCNGQAYRNGRLVNNNVSASTGDCFVYLSPSGLYIDGRTGTAATTVCDGKSYVDGKMVAGSVNTTQPTAPAVTNNRHTVKSGETVYSISRRYGLSVAQLQSWNNLNSNSNLFPGQTLRIRPQSQPTPSSFDMPRSVNPNTPATAMPQGYDDLAARSPATASGEPSLSFHTVTKGETVNEIAKEYGMSIERLRALNNMSDWEIIFPGQQLRVHSSNQSMLAFKDMPDAFEADAGRKVTVSKIEKEEPKVSKTYTVKRGDTLSKIADKHNMTVKELKSMNGLKSDLIRSEQKLKVK